ncbi:MAG TPA: VOC family protein [Thermoleophilaceae bacterium]|nr:VOC family protein [Thermoleophilaceae bacterium]
MVGINHVALEVGDVDEAVDFYGRIFELELRGRVHGMAFLDMGDQFLALAHADEPGAGGEGHLGLVVDDRPRVRAALKEAGVELEPSRGLHFRDPWGNLIEVVQYSDVQFTKTPAVLSGMGLDGLSKSESAQRELREKGLL